MKTIETCNNEKCRYNNQTNCSLDKIINNFKKDPCACTSCCEANGNQVVKIVLKELEESGTCPRFL